MNLMGKLNIEKERSDEDCGFFVEEGDTAGYKIP